MKPLIISLLVLVLLGGCSTVEDFVDEATEEVKQRIRDKVDEVLE